MKPKTRVADDLHLSHLSGAKKATDKKYKEALKEIDRLHREQEEVFKVKRTIQTFAINEYKKARENESTETTPIILASDWHIEEMVDPDTVSGMNEYNLDISKERATRFFRSVARLIEIFKQDTTIKRAIIGLLGD